MKLVLLFALLLFYQTNFSQDTLNLINSKFTYEDKSIFISENWKFTVPEIHLIGKI